MRKTYLDWFEENKVDLDSLIDQASKFASKFVSKNIEEYVKDDEDGKPQTYFNASGVRYDNGQLVEQYEKEYVNGKCTKNEHKAINLDSNQLEDKKEHKHQCTNNLECTCSKNNKKLTELAELEKKIHDLNSKIESLNNKFVEAEEENLKLSAENCELNKILDNIKNCLS